MPRPSQALLPLALAATFLAVLLTPRAFGPMAALVAGLAAAAVLAPTLGRAGRLRVDGSSARALLIPGIALVWLLVCTVLAQDTGISLVGIAGQHTGWLLWLMLLLVFAVGYGSATPADARRVISTVGALAGLAGAALILDAVIGNRSAVFSIAPSGLFENSLSANQYLVLGLGCAVGWLALWPRLGGAGRVLAVASATAASIGLALSASRAGLVGLIAAVGLGVVVRLLGRTPRRGRRLASAIAAAWVLVFCVAFGALGAASTGVLGQDAERAWSEIANNRDDIWDSAVTGAGERLVFGSGPDQFSALTRWTLEADGHLDYQGTYDPHGIGLYWLVSAGIPGLALAAAAAASLLAGLVALALGRGAPLALLGPVGGLVGWGVTLGVAWTNPLAATAAAMVAGALLGAARERPGGPGGPRWIPWAISAAAVAGLVVLTPAAVAEFPFQAAEPAQQATVGRTAYERWPDPSFAVAFASTAGRLDAGDHLTSNDSLDVGLSVAEWDVNVAILAALGTQDASSMGSDARWASFEDLMEAGRSADPASGIWDTLAALEASRRGLHAVASDYASEAAKHDATDDVRELMEDRFPDAFAD